MSLSGYFKANWAAPQGYREVLRIGLPLLAGMASSTVMQFTDRLFLSHYSLDAIAAAMPASVASMTLHMTLYGICSYTGVLAAQYVGARALHRVGPAVWQGIWCALACTVFLVLCCLPARALFDWVGHPEHIRILEIQYYVVLTAGGGIGLFTAAVSGFFYGRGQTKPVMMASIAAAIINVPLDYALIFGAWGLPELGIIGAGLGTCAGWLLQLLILLPLVMNRKNDQRFYTIRGWKPEWELFKKLIRFGVPSGMNMMVEFAAMAWFTFLLGRLGTVALAASNIAFSINSLVFMPMIGLNMATATLVGQAMGREKPEEAERATFHALHLAASYMIAMAVVIVAFAGGLMDIFSPAGTDGANFAPVRAVGVVLLYYVALYSLVDSANLIFIGALKGAGDTVAVMKIIVCCVAGTLFLPMLLLQWLDLIGLHSLWIIFTAYIFILALCAWMRFKGRKWHAIKMVEDSARNAAI